MKTYKFGIATDHDIPASAYSVGCRHFIMIKLSNLYHFVCRTVSKLPKKEKSSGETEFLEKWGMTIKQFRKEMEIAKPYKQVKDGIL